MINEKSPLYWKSIIAGIAIAVIGGFSVALFTHWLNKDSKQSELLPYRKLEHTKLVPHYYSLINTSQYKKAWSLLSKEFRRKAHYGEFSHFTQNYRNMKLCTISASYNNLTNQTSTSATYEVAVSIKNGDSCKEVNEKYMFALSKFPDMNAWVISRVFSK